jgi:hypothetical protein
LKLVEGVPFLDASLDYESRHDATQLVFRRLVLDQLSSGLPESIFHADSHARNLMAQTQKTAPLTLVLSDWSEAGRPSAPRRYALISRGSFCGHEPKNVVHTQKYVEPFRRSVRSSVQTLRNHPEPSQRKQRKEENMSAEATKTGTAATSGTIDEVFHEAMRSYEKALKSGIQLQEESVNLWKDLLTKLGSPEELQAKRNSSIVSARP